MATVVQQEKFIGQIAPLAQSAYKALGKVKPSVCIAMACVESGYGTAGSCKHNSYIGQKVGTGKTATKYWGGKFFASKTGEEYTIGQHTTITAAFRSYDNMQQCVNNYYELLNSSLYSRVLAGSDYKTQMQQIKAVGYMTSSTEVKSVLSIISKYNLTQYDTIAPVVVTSEAAPKYTVGKVYTLQKDMRIRKEPNGEQLKYVQLTADAKSHAVVGTDAILKTGTKVTAKEIKESAGTWIRIPSGWVCGTGVDGKVYIK